MIFLIFIISTVHSVEDHGCKMESWVFDRDVACSKDLDDKYYIL